MNNESYITLVNHDLIEPKVKYHLEVSARRAPAVAAAEEADHAVSVAGRALDRALAGDGGDPHQAQNDYDLAVKRADVAQKSIPAIDAAIAIAAKAVDVAVGEAWRPVAVRAWAERHAAIKAGDAARQALADAEQAFHEATAMLITAANRGAGHHMLNNYHMARFHSFAMERQVLSAHGQYFHGVDLLAEPVEAIEAEHPVEHDETAPVVEPEAVAAV